MSAFVWNTRKVKTTIRSEGREIIVEATPADIVKAPNTHRVESIMQSLCLIVSELMKQEEDRHGRIEELMRARAAVDSAIDNVISHEV